MDRRFVGVFVVGAVGLIACATLESIEPDFCGNGVIEGVEDCDDLGRDAGGGPACSAPGSQHACRYQCDSKAGCPAGWGCDLNDGVCVRFSGDFEQKRKLESGAVRMVTGDFDGDGRSDLVLAQPSGLDGTSSATAYFFGESMQVRERRSIPTPMGALFPFPARLSEQATTGAASESDFPLSDLGYSSSSGVGVLRGGADDPLVPELFPFLSLSVELGEAEGLGRIGAIIPVPLPPKSGSSRGRVAYAVAARGKSRDPRLVSFSVTGDAGPPVVFTSGLKGAAGDLRFTTGPVDRPLCLRSSCSNALVWFNANEKTQDRSLYVLDIEDRALPNRRPRIRTLGVEAVGVGDIDGDGHDDIVIRQPPEAKTMRCPVMVSGAALKEATPPGAGEFVITPKAVPEAACAVDPEGQAPPFLGLADLNGDDIADFVYGSDIRLSSRKGGVDGGVGEITWEAGYHRGQSAWTHMEVGDFDGDARPDAVLAVQGQSGLEVVRGTKGEVRIVSVPTPEPVDTIVAGHFDGDGMLDIAYSTKLDYTKTGADAGARREASVYVVFGGPAENQTVRVGHKTLTQLVNMRRPRSESLFHDVDFLGLVVDPETVAGAPTATPAVVGDTLLYAVYAPEGRGLVSVVRAGTGTALGAGLPGIGGRAVAVGAFSGPTKLDAVQVRLSAPNACVPATLEVNTDLHSPVGLEVKSAALEYGPLAPLAVTAGEVGGVATAFTASVEAGKIVLRSAKLEVAGGKGVVTPQVVGSADYALENRCTPNPRTDGLSPAEKLALLDLDDDKNPDLVFSDGGRAPLAGEQRPQGSGLAHGLVVVLRNAGNGTYSPVVSADRQPIRGRSFAKVRLKDGRPALAVLQSKQVVFYTLTDGALRPEGAPLTLEDGLNANALETGDFDGDGVDDLAVLAGGVLRIYAGQQRSSGTADGGGK